METKIKRLSGLGLSAALIGTAALAGCSSEDTSNQQTEAAEQPVAEQVAPAAVAHAHAHGEGGEGGEGEGGEGGHDGHTLETLPVEKRLAFMTGHVEAGISLYRAGEAKMAAPHLLHPVSETHQAERAGIDALGFNATIFEEVSAALDAGEPAESVEPQLKAALENLEAVAQKAGGDQVEVIKYLMSVIVVEYSIAITDGKVSDPGEYQDAWGFAIVAKKRAAGLPDGIREAVIAEINTLISLWPESPVPPAEPTPVGKVVAQTSKVLLKL